jgi:RNA polymerase sigma-70 factor (ECF subfamily)
MADLTADRRRIGSQGFADAWHPVTLASDELERHELKQAIAAEVARLPDKYRAAVVLCDLEGLTHQEAAQRLGWPSGSISRRLQKARSILRLQLAKKGLALAVVGVVATAVLWNANQPKPGRIDNERAFVRQTMTSFTHRYETSDGPGQWLKEWTRQPGIEPNPELAQVIGRDAVAVARAIKNHTPDESHASGENDARRNEWRKYATAMEISAERLALAGEAGGPAGIVAAARSLEASCVDCHRGFRVE